MISIIMAWVRRVACFNYNNPLSKKNLKIEYH